MSRGKPYKHQKKGAARFVQLHHWFMDCEAWRTLKPGPRQLYVELKRRFTGSNNGRIRLSHREAAEALGVSRNTVGPWFAELEARGFIRMTRAPHLGPSGVGLASEWALEEEATPDGRPPGKAFMRWTEKQNPRPNSGTPRPRNRDAGRFLAAESG
jgi:DNA-binding transcriptional MocR family regulator